MKFAVGYQLSEPGEASFIDLLAPYRASLGELFFAWPGHPSGRSPIGLDGDRPDPDALRRFETDLGDARDLGLTLDLLVNANCYGGAAMSVALEDEVVRVLRRLEETAGGAGVVTTTSPAVAWIVKRHFPAILTRASVNMRIGTLEGMRYLADRFDSYHVQRECNRKPEHLRELKAWADRHDKTLVLQANSGCLRHCSAQTFHDNLVAHETEVRRHQNLPGFAPFLCWNLMRDKIHWPLVLQATWIRPEDLHHYDGLFPLVKLATRFHDRPDGVLRAYSRRRWLGNLLDLLEPGFAPAFAPYVMDNARFPADWFEHTLTCPGPARPCRDCERILAQILVKPQYGCQRESR